jgi:hypothetical protein
MAATGSHMAAIIATRHGSATLCAMASYVGVAIRLQQFGKRFFSGSLTVPSAIACLREVLWVGGSQRRAMQSVAAPSVTNAFAPHAKPGKVAVIAAMLLAATWSTVARRRSPVPPFFQSARPPAQLLTHATVSSAANATTDSGGEAETRLGQAELWDGRERRSLRSQSRRLTTAPRLWTQRTVDVERSEPKG